MTDTYSFYLIKIPILVGALKKIKEMNQNHPALLTFRE